jgi:hypothetical protein
VGRIDAAGNLLWERVIDEEGEGAELYAITVTHDGGFLAAGFWQLGEGDVRGFYLARFDEMGNLLWTRTDLDVDVPWRARAVSPTDDGGFVIVSEAYSENFIRKIDALGYAEPYEGD